MVCWGPSRRRSSTRVRRYRTFSSVHLLTRWAVRLSCRRCSSCFRAYRIMAFAALTGMAISATSTRRDSKDRTRFWMMASSISVCLLIESRSACVRTSISTADSTAQKTFYRCDPVGTTNLNNPSNTCQAPTPRSSAARGLRSGALLGRRRFVVFSVSRIPAMQANRPRMPSNSTAKLPDRNGREREASHECQQLHRTTEDRHRSMVGPPQVTELMQIVN